MKNSVIRTVLVSVLLATYVPLSANRPSFGVYSSPKGFGLTITKEHAKADNSFTLYFDMYGIYMSRTDIPGAKFNYSRIHTFKKWEQEEYSLCFYGGPGCSIGYVFDYEKGWDKLQRSQGAMTALSYTAGLKMDFSSSKVSLDFSLEPELGLHLRRDNSADNNSLSLYVNGLIQSIYPQVSIFYRF